MSSDDRMNAITNELNLAHERAAWFVSQNTAGKHQDKRLAEMFGISPNMAYRLKKGEGWTVERLSQASRLFGWTFVQFVFGPIAGQRGTFDVTSEIFDLQARLGRLAASIAAGPFGGGNSSVALHGRPVDSRPAVHGAERAGGPSEEEGAGLKQAAE